MMQLATTEVGIPSSESREGDVAVPEHEACKLKAEVLEREACKLEAHGQWPMAMKEAEVAALEREACKLEAEADALEKGAATAGAKCVFLGQWKAHFNGNFWHDVTVTCHGDISEGGLTATMTKRVGELKELPIAIDKEWGVWRCGNGWLSNNIEYDNNQATVLEWITDDGRVSTWQRFSEVDNTDSSTDAGTEADLKETWWNATEEWEGEKRAMKAKMKKWNEEAYEYTAQIPTYARILGEDGKRNQQKATTKTTTTRKNYSRREGDREVDAKWVEVAAKTQKASRGTRKKEPQWREVSAGKHDSEWVEKGQHKAAY